MNMNIDYLNFKYENTNFCKELRISKPIVCRNFITGKPIFKDRNEFNIKKNLIEQEVKYTVTDLIRYIAKSLWVRDKFEQYEIPYKYIDECKDYIIEKIFDNLIDIDVDKEFMSTINNDNLDYAHEDVVYVKGNGHGLLLYANKYFHEWFRKKTISIENARKSRML